MDRSFYCRDCPALFFWLSRPYVLPDTCDPENIAVYPVLPYARYPIRDCEAQAGSLSRCVTITARFSL